MATPSEAAAILNRLVEELGRRWSEIDELDRAYAGDFRLQFASEDFRDFFADRYRRFSDNWCGVVADAPHERLEITGVRLPGQNDGDEELFDWWRRTNSDAGSDLAFLDAIIAKRAFALVWGDSEGRPIVTWEHPSQAIVGYDPATRERVAGAKFWSDESTDFATLYLPSEVWKFQRPTMRTGVDPQFHEVSGPILDGGWDLREEGVIPNPLGMVPLVEFQNKPRLARDPHSDIAGTLAMQHAINLFWGELFAVADEATLGARGIIGAERPVMPILDADGNVVGEKPIDLKKWRRDHFGWIEDPNAKPFEWKPAALEPFTNVIDIMVGHIAAQTRTPAHYLLIGGTLANISADAMKALETGLVKRTQEKTQHFGRAARDVFELIALVLDNPGKAADVRGGLTLWKDVENRSDAQLADAALKDAQIGLPLQYILERRYNLSPSEIKRVMDMRSAELTDPLLAEIRREVAGGDAAAAVGE